MSNLLKSVFISTFPVMGLSACIYQAMIWIRHGFSLTGLGMFVSGLTIVLFFLFLFIFRRPRTDANLKSYTFFILIGAIISIIEFSIYQGEWNIILVSIFLFLGWMVYLFWYSRFASRSEHEELNVGQILPKLVLQDHAGNEVMSDSFLGNYAIYLFYRGNWCPLCVAQIKEIAEQYKELASRGVHTILISPQPHAQTESIASRYDVGFNFLVDDKNKVARQLGILSEHGIPMGFQILGYDSDTVLPTVIITDPKGKIIFADLTDNYRVRPEPSTFLEIIDSDGRHV